MNPILANFRNWFVDQFDTFVTENDEGVELEKSRDAVAHAYADAVEAGDIARWDADTTSEGRGLFDRLVKPVREQRKSTMRSDAQYLVDALNGDTILGRDDPALSQAYPLGDGRDKTLRFWTAEDWRSAVTERYRNAAAVTEAARRLDELADRIVAALVSHGVNTTGDLFAA